MYLYIFGWDALKRDKNRKRGKEFKNITTCTTSLKIEGWGFLRLIEKRISKTLQSVFEFQLHFDYVE